jgi:hypothetical protein
MQDPLRFILSLGVGILVPNVFFFLTVAFVVSALLWTLDLDVLIYRRADIFTDRGDPWASSLSLQLVKEV